MFNHLRGEHPELKNPTYYFVVLTLAMLLTGPARGQVTQPRIVQKVVDDFMVERKTGRFSLSATDQIRIGGADEVALSVSYGPVDGSDFQQNGIPRLSYNQIRKEGSLNYYDYYTVEYNGIGDTFRKDTGTTAPLTSQYSTGSTLVSSGGHYLFTDKFGIQIDFGTDTNVTYPDGRQVRFVGLSTSMSFEDKDRTKRSIVNNFGYMLKFINSGLHLDIQAINLSKNYCDLTSAISCAGLLQTRKASVDSLGGIRIVSDADGGVTKYTFQQMYAFDYERICITLQNGSQCPDPPSWYRWYPTSVALPDSSAPVYSITYEKKGDVHDDIFVKSVQKGDILASYFTVKNKYGSWGSNPYNLAFYLTTWVTISGQQNNYTRAVRPIPEWGSARRALMYSGDGLGRETTFSRNQLQEVSGTTYPEGNGEMLQYDSRYNVIARVVSAKPASGLPQQVTQYTYPPSCSASTQAYCNKPMTMVDPKGGTSNYSYNLRGQILEEIAPAPSVGAPRLKKVYTYELRTAFVLDASANLVPAGPPISLPVKIVTCDTTSACAGGGTDTVAQYDYGPPTGVNNLNLRGVSVTALDASGIARTHLTCYSYNYFGEKISETRPNAGLAACM
ncbi:hypothetical protein ACVWZA_004396 [Sphingomonas sp. UYAg733]